MWKYSMGTPECLGMRIGMVITSRRSGYKETIRRIERMDAWMGCRYPMNWIIYTDVNPTYGSGPLYYREFDCMNCRYIVKHHIINTGIIDTSEV